MGKNRPGYKNRPYNLSCTICKYYCHVPSSIKQHINTKKHINNEKLYNENIMHKILEPIEIIISI